MTKKSAVSRAEANRARAIHGHAARGSWTKIYTTWYSIRQRCNNPKTIGWRYYGGKGIKVCEQWNSFQVFLADMGEPPSSKHSIDRIDNSKDYGPENCRWATKKEQDNNRSSNVLVTYQETTLNIQGWAEKIGISYTALYQRLQVAKWSAERALTTPVRKTP